MGFAGADDVVKTALKTMTNQAEEYCNSGKWNWGEVAPWKAPEYLYTVAIGRKLAGPAARGVYFEHNIPKLVKMAKTGSGAPKKPKKTRCDIAIKDGKTAIPRMCIEVKSRFQIDDDVDLCRLVVRGKSKSQLRDAAVIFIACAQNKEIMRKNYDGWRKKWCEENERIVALDGKGKVAKSFNKIKFHKYKDEQKPQQKPWYWYVGAIQMSHPGE